MNKVLEEEDCSEVKNEEGGNDDFRGDDEGDTDNNQSQR